MSQGRIWPQILEHGAECFLAEKKVAGSVKNVAKKPKDVLIEAYEDLFKTGAFKGSELDVVVEKIEKVAVKDTKEEKFSAEINFDCLMYLSWPIFL